MARAELFKVWASLWAAVSVAGVLAATALADEAEGRLLSDGTGARQQQIARALETGIEDHLATR